MSEKEIFEHLLLIASQSKDTDGVVTSCLVRNGEIFADAVSTGVEHAEYMLLQNLNNKNIKILPIDTIYVTLQPCDHRSSNSGELLGDCTTNIINSGTKNVVYAAIDPRSKNSLARFVESGVSVRQYNDVEIVKQAVKLFNSTNIDSKKHIPAP